MSHPATHDALLAAMKAAADAASVVILRYFNGLNQLTTSEKGKADFVSSADLESEQTIRQVLDGCFPQSRFLMEEAGSVESASALRWIVDPIDGTANFIRGFPFFSVSIAAEVGGSVVAGLVHDPLRGETFTAAQGQGACLNGAPIAPSTVTEPRRAVISSGLPYKSQPDFPHFLSASNRLMDDGVTMRRTGSAALDLCYTAAGRLDGHFAVGLSPWDVSAGIIICREAGVTVDEQTGNGRFATGAMLSANPTLYAKLALLVAG